MNRIYIMLLFVPLIWSCKSDSPAGTNVRPPNFPDFLKPSINMVDVQYRNSETGGVADGTFSLVYLAEEDFPPLSTINFIQNELSSAGFFCAKYLMLGLPQEVEVLHHWRPDRHREDGYIHLIWSEYWIHREKCECVFVVYSYRYKKGEDVSKKAEIAMVYSSEKSDMSAIVKRYKEHYPTEDWEKEPSGIDYGKLKGSDTISD